jgi:ABC-type transporter Mla subunit MlaD
MNDTLLMVFTGILAFAVLMQTILFFGMYRAIRQMSAYLNGLGKDLRKNAELISAKVDEGVTAIKGLAEGFKPIRDKLADSTEIIHYRITELDAFLAETTATARQEIRHIQDTFQAASQKVEQTLETLRQSLLGPLKEISAVTRAVRVAMDVLFRRRRNPSSSQDDEMFI